MTVQLNGVTIELPNNAKVEVSEDGNSVKVSLPEQQVVEKIRLVPSTEPKVVEKIKIVEKPCALLHYPRSNPNHATYKIRSKKQILSNNPKSSE